MGFVNEVKWPSWKWKEEEEKKMDLREGVWRGRLEGSEGGQELGGAG